MSVDSTPTSPEDGDGEISFIESSFAGVHYAGLSADRGDVLSDADPDPIIPGAQYAAANVVRNDRTGNPTIDKTTDRLIQTLDTVSETLGPGSGPYYGVVVHTEFARSVRAQDLPGVGKAGVEQSFSLETWRDTGWTARLEPMLFSAIPAAATGHRLPFGMSRLAVPGCAVPA